MTDTNDDQNVGPDTDWSESFANLYGDEGGESPPSPTSKTEPPKPDGPKQEGGAPVPDKPKDPDVVTVPKKTDKKKDEKKPQGEEPKKKAGPEEDKDKKKQDNPYLQMVEDMLKFVSEADKMWNKAGGKIASKTGEAIMSTDAGKAVSEGFDNLKGALKDKIKELGYDAADKVGNSALGKGAQAISSGISDTVGKAVQGLVKAMSGLAEKIAPKKEGPEEGAKNDGTEKPGEEAEDQEKAKAKGPEAQLAQMQNMMKEFQSMYDKLAKAAVSVLTDASPDASKKDSGKPEPKPGAKKEDEEPEKDAEATKSKDPTQAKMDELKKFIDSMQEMYSKLASAMGQSLAGAMKWSPGAKEPDDPTVEKEGPDVEDEEEDELEDEEEDELDAENEDEEDYGLAELFKEDDIPMSKPGETMSMASINIPDTSQVQSGGKDSPKSGVTPEMDEGAELLDTGPTNM
ncbi:MAG: hypothetical protein ACRCXC_11610 [Legionella sp.]